MLFEPFTAAQLKLSNRAVMSPMTRNRAVENNTPNALMAEYYAQRATAGLIITEGTTIETRDAATLLLVGGVPFDEPVLMWWNFVARTSEELLAASREWNAGIDRFGRVSGYDGDRVLAPLPPWAAEA